MSWCTCRRSKEFKVFILTLHWIAVYHAECLSVTNNTTFAHMDWMSNLSHGLQNTPLKYLSIPGSHDSGTYSLKKDNVDIFQNKYSKYIHMANKMPGKESLSEVIYRWSKTQNLNITQQLSLGVRYFDVRVAMDRNKRTRVVHGLLGDSLDSILHQFKLFLVKHTKEVVLIDFSNIHRSMKEEELVDKSMLRSIFKICGKNLCPEKLADKSLREIWEHKCQIFAFYERSTNGKNIYGDNMSYICPKTMVTSPFDLQTFTQPSKWITFLDHTYKSSSPHFHVIQGIMQPHWMEIAIAGISETATLKDWVSDDASSELLKWLEGKHNGKDGVKIVMADFIENHKFVETIISLNTVSTSTTMHQDCNVQILLLLVMCTILCNLNENT